jgi:hypothetical protein
MQRRIILGVWLPTLILDLLCNTACRRTEVSSAAPIAKVEVRWPLERNLTAAAVGNYTPDVDYFPEKSEFPLENKPLAELAIHPG